MHTENLPLTASIKIVPLGQFIEECKLKNNQNADVWSVTNKNGGSFVLQNQRFLEQVASEDTSNYKIVLPRNFAYSPPRINVGSIAFNDSKNMGCVSPMYVVFKISDESLLNPNYLYWLLQSEQFKEQINNFAFGSVRQTVSFDDFCKISIPLPSLEEQESIVNELDYYYKMAGNATSLMNNWKPYIKAEKDWKNIRLKNLLKSPPQYGLSKAMNDTKIGYKILRMGNLQSGILNLSDIKHIDITQDEFEKYRLKRGDLLFNRTNSFELVGKTSIFDTDEQYCFASYLVRIVVDKTKIREDFLNFFINTDVFQQSIKMQAKQSNNQANINPQILIEQVIPLPTLAVQKNIVEQFKQEKLLVEGKRKLVESYTQKIEKKLNLIWQSEDTKIVADKSIFDILVGNYPLTTSNNFCNYPSLREGAWKATSKGN